MAQKSRRPGTEISAGEAVRRILAAGSACSRAYRLPAEGGPQLTMTGEEQALGNLSVLPAPALKEALSSLPAMKKTPDAVLEAYASRRRFFLLTGERDRLVSLAASVEALIRAGYARILLLADTPSERDGLADFLRLTVPGLGGGAGVYLPQDAGARDCGRAFAPVYAYLTSPGPQILLIDAASFCRRTNLLRRPLFSGGKSFADLIAEGEPAVLCSARSVDGTRNLARAAEVFSPALSLLITASSGRIRDAVIFRSGSVRRPNGKSEDTPAPEQIRF